MEEKEVYKSVVGYESFYEVSNLGNVRSLDRTHTFNRCKGIVTAKYKGSVRKGVLNNWGYLKVQLRTPGHSKGKYIHIMVAEAFLGHIPKRGLVVHHKDENKRNNRVTNLEVITHSDNVRRAQTKVRDIPELNK